MTDRLAEIRTRLPKALEHGVGFASVTVEFLLAELDAAQARLAKAEEALQTCTSFSALARAYFSNQGGK